MKTYTLEVIKRIDVRYYKIKINGKMYVIDYSNPKDIRTFFPGLFTDSNNQWKIYDSPNSDTPRKIYKNNIRWSVIFFVLYLVNVIFFPKRYNLNEISYNPLILEHWQLVMLFVFIGAAIICTVLNIFCHFSKYKIDSMHTKTYLLKKVNNQKNTESSNKIIHGLKWFMSYLILLALFAIIGLASSSYSQLIVFFIIPTYLLLFGKFIQFNPSKSSKYIIIEKEC